MAETIVVEARFRDAGATSGVRTLRGELKEVGDAAATAGRKGSAGLGRVEDASKRAERAMRNLQSSAASASAWLGSKLASAIRIGTIGIVGLVTAVAGFGIKAASSFQQSQLAFETLLGSAQAGKQLFQDLQGIALKTPFETTELASATQLLLRYGVTAQQVQPVLKSLLDAAALTTDPSGNLQTAALAVGQIVSSGRILGQDANQLTQAGIPVYELFAKKLGITALQARKLGEDGKLSADQFLQGLTAMEGPLAKLQGGAEKLSHTLTGQLSNFKDAIRVRLGKASAPLVDQVEALIPRATALVGTAIDKVGPPIFRLVTLLIDGLMRTLPIVEPLVTTVLDGLIKVGNAAAPALAGLGPVAGQLQGSLVELIDALVKATPDLVRLFVALVAILPDFVSTLAQLVPLVSPVLKIVTALLGLDPVRGILSKLLIALLAFRAVNQVVGTMKDFAAALHLVSREQAQVARTSTVGGTPTVGGPAARSTVGRTAKDAAGRFAIGALLTADATAVGNIVQHVKKNGFHLQNPFGSGAPSLGSTFNAAFGDVAGNVAQTSRLHAAAAGMVGGRSSVTSTVRNFGLAGSSSGHLTGKAFDVAADRPHAYAGAIRSMGGYANVHDSGSGRHVHAQIGDSTFAPHASPGGAGGGGIAVSIRIDQVVGQVDFERGVANATAAGLAAHERELIRRGNKDRNRT